MLVVMHVLSLIQLLEFTGLLGLFFYRLGSWAGGETEYVNTCDLQQWMYYAGRAGVVKVIIWYVYIFLSWLLDL